MSDRRRSCGKKVWFFPDGELPPPEVGEMLGHESLIVLNAGGSVARVKMILYFEDRDPADGIEFDVAPRRVRCLRMDKPEHLGGFAVPIAVQYAIELRSDRPVIVQYGRLDTRQANMAFYTTMAYAT